MDAKRAYRDRGAVEVAVLDALVDRRDEGMTVFELRASVDADIEAIEAALAELKRDGLITVTRSDGSTFIRPAERAIPVPDDDPEDPSVIDRLRRRFPF